jgi:hypothetical protein
VQWPTWEAAYALPCSFNILLMLRRNLAEANRPFEKRDLVPV